MKKCFMPNCDNNDKNSSKVFVYIPKNLEIRKRWWEAAGYSSTKLFVTAQLHCCEDHFSIPDDFENWYYVKSFGGRLQLRPGVLPRSVNERKNVLESASDNPPKLKEVTEKDTDQGLLPREPLSREADIEPLSGPGEAQKSKWFAWDSMKFLSDSEETEDNVENTETNIPSMKNDEDTSNLCDETLTIKSEPVEEDDYAANNDIDATPQNEVYTTKDSSPEGEPEIKRKRDMEQFYDVFRLVQNRLMEKDECGLFGDFIAEKLRKLDSSTRSVLQYQIHNQIFEAEMNQKNLLSKEN